MNPVLVLQSRIGALAPDFKDHLLEAATFGLALRDDVYLPAARFRVAAVHLEEIGGKKCRLVASSPLTDLDDDVLLVVRIFRDQGHLQLGLQPIPFRLLALELLAGVGLHLRVTLLFGQFARLADAAVGPAVRLVELDQLPKLRLLLTESLQLSEIGVDPGIREAVGDRVVSGSNGLELLEHQAAASCSSCRAAAKDASATSSCRSSGSRVVSFWVRRKGRIRTLTTGLLRLRPAKRMNS